MFDPLVRSSLVKWIGKSLKRATMFWPYSAELQQGRLPHIGSTNKGYLAEGQAKAHFTPILPKFSGTTAAFRFIEIHISFSQSEQQTTLSIVSSEFHHSQNQVYHEPNG